MKILSLHCDYIKFKPVKKALKNPEELSKEREKEIQVKDCLVIFTAVERHDSLNDVNELVKDNSLPVFDLVYYDPPYNQHPYGSNYFMLNIINEGKAREIQNGVSGIAKEWNKSAYNKKKLAEEAMDKLLADTRAKFIAISYNDEGIIPTENFKNILSRYGKWELMEQDYNTYRGSRNLRGRDIKVKEHLWILEKNPIYL